MVNSWKIGAISGFITSLFTSIFLWPFWEKMIISMEFWAPEWRLVKQNAIEVSIIVNIIWFVIGGIVYAKVYPVLPGKGALKGLFFGLIIYCITGVRFAFFYLVYGDYLNAIGGSLSYLTWIPFGLVMGIIYEFLCSKYCPIKDLKIQKYSLMSGFHPGAIAGLMGGIVAGLITYSVPLFGLPPILGVPADQPFDVYMVQSLSHMFFNMFWGTIFGLMFTQVYDLVPGKKITKGLFYGLIIWFLTTFYGYIYVYLMLASVGVWWTFPASLAEDLVGVANATVFGLVLGLLYRKPKASSTKKEEDIQTVRMLKCIHCSASIAKGSDFCNKCGKKQ